MRGRREETVDRNGDLGWGEKGLVSELGSFDLEGTMRGLFTTRICPSREILTVKGVRQRIRSPVPGDRPRRVANIRWSPVRRLYLSGGVAKGR